MRRILFLAALCFIVSSAASAGSAISSADKADHNCSSAGNPVAVQAFSDSDFRLASTATGSSDAPVPAVLLASSEPVAQDECTIRICPDDPYNCMEIPCDAWDE